jgi:DNA repair exonuclease SbcCD ATPase subunit
MASQGEIAITTISLSLALIEQSIGAYNILCLDEIDGPLDGDNRNNFINIIKNIFSSRTCSKVRSICY